jgi:GTP pyrophosphokinase
MASAPVFTPALDHISDPKERKQILSVIRLANTKLSALRRFDLSHIAQGFEIIEAWRLPAEAIRTLLAYHLLRFRAVDESEAKRHFEEKTLHRASELLSLDAALPHAGEQEEIKRSHRYNRQRRLFYLAYTDTHTALTAVILHVIKMRRVETLEPAAARHLCEDSMAVYSALIEMLGLWEIYREMGEICLRLLNPRRIWDKIEQHKRDIEVAVRRIHQAVCPLLEADLRNAGLQATVTPNITSNTSVYRHTLRGESVSQALRTVKFRVILPSEDEAYRALRVIHARWAPVSWRTQPDGPFRDFLAAPKFNSYRALVTNVEYVPATDNPHTPPLEFRLFTDEIEQVNMLGIVYAHYLSAPQKKIRGAWWDNEELKDLLGRCPPDSTGDPIYVFSPAGKVYAGLPSGSVPIDYAYRIHSDVGDHCKRVWINGQSAKLAQKLHNGDLVYIETDANMTAPNPSWLGVVKTSTAQRRIQRHLARQAPHKGRRIFDKLLEAELKLHQIQEKISSEEIDLYLKDVADRLGYTDLEALYLDLARPQPGSRAAELSPNRLAARFIGRRLAERLVRSDAQPLGAPLDRVRFTQCNHPGCSPRILPGSPIVGRLKGAGKDYPTLVVYAQGCRHAPSAEQAAPLEWRARPRLGEPVRVRIQAVDRKRLLGEVLNEVYSMNGQEASLREVEARVDREGKALIKLTLEAPDFTILDEFEHRLEAMRRSGAIDALSVEALSPLDMMLLNQADVYHIPYTPNAVDDPRIFKGRDAEIQRTISALEDNQKCVTIYGISRVGKTSLLRYLSKVALPERNFAPVFIDLQGLPARRESVFWETVFSQLTRRLDAHLSSLGKRRKMGVETPYGRLLAWLEQVKKDLPGLRPVLLFDEINILDDVWQERANAVQIVEQLRSLVSSELNLQCVFAVQEDLYRRSRLGSELSLLSSLLRMGVDTRLDMLDRRAAERLIHEPMSQKLRFEEALAESALRLTACHPFYLQLLLFELAQQARLERRSLVRTGDLETTLPTLLVNGDQIFQQYLREPRGFKRDVLSLMAARGEDEARWASLAEIQQALRQRGYEEVSLYGLSEALDALKEASAIERRSALGKPEFAIRVPLFGRWLAHKQPVSLIFPAPRKVKR